MKPEHKDHSDVDTLIVSKISNLRCNIKQMALCLKFLAQIINQLKVFLPPTITQFFKHFETRYNYFYNIHEQSTINAGRGIEDSLFSAVKACEVEQQELQLFIIRLFKKISEILDHPKLQEKIWMIHNLLNQTRVSINEELSFNSLEQALQNFLDALQEYEKVFFESFELKHIAANGIIAKKLGHYYHDAIRHQQALCNLHLHLNSFALTASELNTTGKKQIRLSANKKNYQELVIFSCWVNPKWVPILLMKQESLLRKQLGLYINIKKKLEQKLYEYFPKVLRLFRVIDAYQKWQDYLNKQLINIQKNSMSFLVLLSKQQLITYQKKAFFKSVFSQQQAWFVTKELHDYLQQTNLMGYNSTDIVQNLLLRRNRLRQQAQASEQSAIKNYYLMTKIAGTCVLAITQQPTYQLGRLTFRKLSQQTEASAIPILNEHLSRELQNNIEHLTGISFLIMTLMASSSIGYSWPFISMLNHILRAHYHTASYLDQLLQCCMTPIKDCLISTIPYFKNYWQCLAESVSIDEFVLFQKEKIIAYLFGLLVHWLIVANDDNFVETTLAYTMASSCSELAVFFSQYLEEKLFNASSNSSTLKLLVHLVTFSNVYGYCRRLFFAKNDTSGLSEAQALKLFGLFSPASNTEIRARYRELALENHPDKCGLVCRLPMNDINQAYQVLLRNK